jgi:hypothetical protein
VRDSGPGLAPDDLPRAFERFFLYERYRGERPVGTGLGLAVVKELSEAMGGSVDVQSVPGQGSVFTVRLPIGSPMAPTIAGPAETSEGAASSVPGISPGGPTFRASQPFPPGC